MKYLFLSFCFVFVLNHVLAQKFYVPYEHIGKYGLTDEKFQSIITPAIYDKIEPIADSLFIVTKHKKKGVINNQGKLIIPIKYTSFSSTYYKCKEKLYRNFLIIADNLDDTKCYFDYFGDRIKIHCKIPLSIFGPPSEVSCGFFDVNNSPEIFRNKIGKYGIVQQRVMKGNPPFIDTILEPIYDSIYPYIQGEWRISLIYIIIKNDSIAVANESFKIILQLNNYKNIHRINSSLIAFQYAHSPLWGVVYYNFSTNPSAHIIQPAFTNILNSYSFYEKFLNEKEKWKLFIPIESKIFLVKDDSGNTYYENLQTGFKYQN